MGLRVNLRHLEAKDLRLQGEIPVAELDLDNADELVHLEEPLRYDLEVEKLERNILAQGKVELNLRCECARCLKPFTHPISFSPWVCHLPLDGEEAVAVENDRIDLTPFLREDILLAFPQHPLCKPDCTGLSSGRDGTKSVPGGSSKSAPAAAWAELNKLKFDE